MRSHGVSNFPDPNAEGISVLPSNIKPQSRAPVRRKEMRAAAAGAQRRVTDPGEQKAPADRDRGVQRKHGVPNLPDPMFRGGTVDLGGAEPDNAQSPAFRHAATVCTFPTPRGGVVNTAAPPR